MQHGTTMKTMKMKNNKSVSTESNNGFPVHCFPTYVNVSSLSGVESGAMNQQQFCLFNIVVELRSISYCCQKYKHYLDLHVKCTILMSDLNQIWIF